MQPDEVVDLAPLMFLILAEKCLASRRENLAQARSACSLIDTVIPHFSNELDNLSTRIHEVLDGEHDSIARRGLFGGDIFEGGGQGNPFMHYLWTLASQLPTELFTPNSVEWALPDEIGYAILEGELRRATGITDGFENHVALLHRIRCGAIELDQALAKKKELSQSEYRDWLCERLEAEFAEEKKALDVLFKQIQGKG